jgi:putative NIF3 family GTP cyclohydrolase 1 type 2
MALVTDLIDHLDDLLSPAAFDDYAPSGLQVPGPDEVSTVATGV